MRNQFTFYESFYEAISHLKRKDDRLSLYEAITMYALTGELPSMTDTAEAMFCLIRPTLDASAKKSAGGKQSPKMKEANEEDTGKIPARYAEDIDKEKKNEKEKEKEGEIEKENECYARGRASLSTSSRMHRPTLDEVKAYCFERGKGTDAEAFFDFYEAKGWKVGSAPMKDWKAAVRNWERKDRERQPKGYDNPFVRMAQEGIFDETE